MIHGNPPRAGFFISRSRKLENVSTTANSTHLIVSSAPAVFFGCTAYNADTVDRFIQYHDAASLPSNGSVPKVSLKIYAEDNHALDYDNFGRKYKNGLVICLSTTQETLTLATAKLWVDAQVEVNNG